MIHLNLNYILLIVCTVNWVVVFGFAGIAFTIVGAGYKLYIRYVDNNKIKKKERFDKEKYIDEIKPVFDFGGAYRNSGNSEQGMHKDNGFIQYPVKNRGGNATLNNCIDLDNNTMKSDIKKYFKKNILHNGIIELTFEPLTKDKRIMECFGHFKLLFEDIERNQYYQIMKVDFNKGIIDEPKEI